MKNKILFRAISTKTQLLKRKQRTLSRRLCSTFSSSIKCNYNGIDIFKTNVIVVAVVMFSRLAKKVPTILQFLPPSRRVSHVKSDYATTIIHHTPLSLYSKHLRLDFE